MLSIFVKRNLKITLVCGSIVFLVICLLRYMQFDEPPFVEHDYLVQPQFRHNDDGRQYDGRHLSPPTVSPPVAAPQPNAPADHLVAAAARQLPDQLLSDRYRRELRDAQHRISELERKLASLAERIPQKYPDVTYLNYKSRKRVLVTGGAGFVGSHLVDQLMMQGHEIIVADNFFTGRKRNVEHWLGHENFELIHHDIVNPLFIEVDEIYHLASPASPPHYMHNPVKTIKTNTVGTINMLGLAKRVGAKVLIASTSEVYGDPDVHPQPETYWGHVNPIGPRACYDEGKRVSETLSYAYAKQERVKVRVARIFNTYGPRMHMNDGRVVSNFILQALQNESITIYGNGKQTRSFQYVSDLVDGLLALMASNYTQPVNIGNPVEHTIEEFAVIIRDLVGGNSSIQTMPAVEDDPQRRKPDITRAKRIINWEPRVPLKDGLHKTIQYFRKELSRTIHSERNFFEPQANTEQQLSQQQQQQSPEQRQTMHHRQRMRGGGS